MHITADPGRCVGSGSCTLLCPEVFGHDEDGVVLVLDEHPDGSTGERARQAVARCPTGAIGIAPDGQGA